MDLDFDFLRGAAKTLGIEVAQLERACSSGGVVVFGYLQLRPLLVESPWFKLHGKTGTKTSSWSALEHLLSDTYDIEMISEGVMATPDGGGWILRRTVLRRDGNIDGAPDESAQICEAPPVHDIFASLIAILKPHYGESGDIEGATEALKRIISERDEAKQQVMFLGGSVQSLYPEEPGAMTALSRLINDRDEARKLYAKVGDYAVKLLTDGAISSEDAGKLGAWSARCAWGPGVDMGIVQREVMQHLGIDPETAGDALSYSGTSMGLRILQNRELELQAEKAKFAIKLANEASEARAVAEAKQHKRTMTMLRKLHEIAGKFGLTLDMELSREQPPHWQLARTEPPVYVSNEPILDHTNLVYFDRFGVIGVDPNAAGEFFSSRISNMFNYLHDNGFVEVQYDEAAQHGVVEGMKHAHLRCVYECSLWLDEPADAARRDDGVDALMCAVRQGPSLEPTMMHISNEFLKEIQDSPEYRDRAFNVSGTKVPDANEVDGPLRQPLFSDRMRGKSLLERAIIAGPPNAEKSVAAAKAAGLQASTYKYVGTAATAGPPMTMWCSWIEYPVDDKPPIINTDVAAQFGDDIACEVDKNTAAPVPPVRGIVGGRISIDEFQRELKYTSPRQPVSPAVDKIANEAPKFDLSSARDMLQWYLQLDLIRKHNDALFKEGLDGLNPLNREPQNRPQFAIPQDLSKYEIPGIAKVMHKHSMAMLEKVQNTKTIMIVAAAEAGVEIEQPFDLEPIFELSTPLEGRNIVQALRAKLRLWATKDLRMPTLEALVIALRDVGFDISEVGPPQFPSCGDGTVRASLRLETGSNFMERHTAWMNARTKKMLDEKELSVDNSIDGPLKPK